MLNIDIKSLDHVVYNVEDPERSLEFYVNRLGLEAVRAEEYRAGSVPFPSVRLSAYTILDFFPPSYHQQTLSGANNVNHIALSLNNSADEIAAFLAERDIPVTREMTGNFGARGDNAHAFHIADPDGNAIELHTYENQGATDVGLD